MIDPPLAVDQVRCADRDGGPGRVPDCGEVGGVSLRGTGGPAGRWWVEGGPGVLPVGGVCERGCRDWWEESCRMGRLGPVGVRDGLRY